MYYSDEQLYNIVGGRFLVITNAGCKIKLFRLICNIYNWFTRR